MHFETLPVGNVNQCSGDLIKIESLRIEEITGFPLVNDINDIIKNVHKTFLDHGKMYNNFAKLSPSPSPSLTSLSFF